MDLDNDGNLDLVYANYQAASASSATTPMQGIGS